jgi:transposase
MGAERADKIELFYLPSYSPELNPEERLNADLKHAIGTKVPARTKAKLKAAATEHMTPRTITRAVKILRRSLNPLPTPYFT